MIDKKHLQELKLCSIHEARVQSVQTCPPGGSMTELTKIKWIETIEQRIKEQRAQGFLGEYASITPYECNRLIKEIKRLRQALLDISESGAGTATLRNHAARILKEEG